MPSPRRKRRTAPSPASAPSPWRLPLLVTAVALVLRVGYLLLAGNAPTFLSPGMDAGLYRSWADAILAGNAPSGPYYRAPLYPWLIAALGWITGDTFWPVRILQVLVSSAMAGVLAMLARRWISPRAGWIAGLAWALYGASIYFDGEELIASLFTSGVIGLLALTDQARLSRWTLYTVLTAALLAVLSALRANALVFVPVIGVALWVYGSRLAVPVPRKLLTLAGALLLILLVLSPVLVHNAHTGGGAFLSGQGGINLYLGNHPGASGAYAVDPEFGRDWTRAQTELRAQREEGRQLSMAEVSDHYTGRALTFWRESPGEALLLLGRKALAVVNTRELGNNRPLGAYLEHVAPPYAVLLLIGFPLVAILGLSALVPAWRTVPPLRPAIGLLAVHAVVLLAFFVNARYRLPLAPVLVLLAAYGVHRLLPSPGRSRSTALRPAALAVLAGVAALVLLPRPITPIDEDEAWRLHHANALLRLDRNREAIAAFQDLLAHHPTTRHAHLNLGVLHLRLNEPSAAMAHLRHEIELYPGSAAAWNNIGVLEEEQHSWERATDAYRAALVADPSHPDARVNLAALRNRMALAATSDSLWTSALDASEEAASLAPEVPRYGYNHALLLAQLGRLADAERVLRDLTVRHPEFAPARDALARVRAARDAARTEADAR